MTPPPWGTILFDYGATLDGDGIHWSRRFDRVFRALGLVYTDEGLNRAFREAEERMNVDPAMSGRGLEAALRLEVGYMLELLAPGSAREEEATARLLAETRQYLARNVAVLQQLHGRARLGILSNFTGNLELILRQEGLRPHVDLVFDSAVVGLRKPDPEFFRHALDRLGGTAAGAVMVGDSVEMDLEPARALGLATVWIEGEAPRSTRFIPDFRLKNVREFLTLTGAIR